VSDISHAPVLHHGAAGEWVMYLQQLLVASDLHQNRWPVTVNGHFDATTEHAVRAYQRWVPLPESGIVDAQTWQHLYETAQGAEHVDEVMGDIAGDHRAGQHGHKLGAGEEVGRAGWRRMHLQCTALDFADGLLNANAYLRFVSATTGEESDEQGRIDDGTLTLHDIWVPTTGTVTAYVGVAQGALTSLNGTLHYDLPRGEHLSFAIRQNHDLREVTVTEAEENGWMYGSKVSVGTDFKVMSVGGELSEQISGGHSHGDTEKVQVKVALHTLTITLA
jgi:peptidoglycan hydrolase-like protein with peptidoglycan-binding domain